MSCLTNRTCGTYGPLHKWTLRFCLTLSSLALITTLYFHSNGTVFTKESFERSEITSLIKGAAYFKTKENNPGSETLRPHNAARNILTVQKNEREKKKRLPQAIIFGVKKCGTHALTDMISLHPQVVHAKAYEVHFFEKNKITGSDKKYQRGLEWYRNRMPLSYEDQITMEKTPSYFISIDAPKRIYEMNSSIKLIVVVREPTTRVVSDYIHTKDLHADFKLKPFGKEVLKPNGEVDKWNFVVKPSLYALHMRRWLQVFKREQILIVDGDKLVSDPLSEITKVEKFLNLPPYVKSDNLFWNPSKGFYCMRSKEKDWCLKPTKGRPHPQMDTKVMEKLRTFFAPLNEEFYKMVGHNFSWPTS